MSEHKRFASHVTVVAMGPAYYDAFVGTGWVCTAMTRKQAALRARQEANRPDFQMRKSEAILAKLQADEQARVAEESKQPTVGAAVVAAVAGMALATHPVLRSQSRRWAGR